MIDKLFILTGPSSRCRRPRLRRGFLPTLPTSRSSLPLLARCQIRLQARHADFYKIDHFLGRLTRDYQVVSLAITRPTKLRFPEIAISGKIAIFDFLDFFRNKNPEESGKSVFWTPGTKIKF